MKKSFAISLDDIRVDGAVMWLHGWIPGKWGNSENIYKHSFKWNEARNAGKEQKEKEISIGHNQRPTTRHFKHVNK